MKKPIPTLPTRELRLPARSGQAIVEFIVGIVVVLVLVAGLLQIASLSKAHTDVVVAARREAALQAMSDLEIPSSPDFIRFLDPGRDGRTYTEDDDDSDPSDPAAFQDTIVHPAGDLDWATIDAVPDNDVSGIHGDPMPATLFGLVQGTESRSVDLLPGFQKLIYQAPSIRVRGEVWMTRTKGIY